MALKITKDWLWRRGACAPECQRFAELWPNGATITIKNVRKAQAADLNLSWFIDAICSRTEASVYWHTLSELAREREDLLSYHDWLNYTAPYHVSAEALTVCCERFADKWAALERKTARAIFIAFMCATHRYQAPRTQAATDRLINATRNKKWC